jgi:glucose-1-phosphate thymidylyltransferase
MTQISELMGVILAAGKGTRMHPFSTHYPKPILPVMGKPLIVHQIESLAALGIEDIVIVIGHLGHEVVRELGDGSKYGVRLDYVEQEQTLGIAHAVSKLERHVDRPFFLFLGDIFFEFKSADGLASMVERLDSDRGTSGVLAVRQEPDREAIRRNFIVVADATDRVTRVIEKPQHPRVDVKGCGIYLFQNDFFDSVRRTPRTALRDEYEITDSIQIFIDDGYRVEAADVIHRDLNVSYAKDLLDLNLYALGKSGAENHRGEDVEVHPGAELQRCILMDGVKIDSAITMQDCLVFPGVQVSAGRDYDHVILTGDAEIQCDE